MRSSENNGIYGYENSKHKKVRDSFLESVANDGYKGSVDGVEKENLTSSMDELSAYMGSEQERWSSPLNAEQRTSEYISSARDYIVPEDNELRRRRQFVMSDRAINDATDSYYNSRVKGVFEREKAGAKSSALEAYKNSISVAGADPVAAAGAMRDVADPARVVQKTMQQLPAEEIDAVAGSYAHYAGLSPEKYREKVFKPAIEERMMGEYVDEATPKSSAEYIARSALDNSLTGKLVNFGQKAYSPSSSHDEINRRGLTAYDANRLENLAAGIGSLAVDMPAFSAIGGASSRAVGGALSNVVKGLSLNLSKKYASRGMALSEAERIIKRAMVGKMGAKIAQSSAAHGLTLGGYDAANSLADDLLYNEGIDVGKALDAYAHGLATGAAVGVVGTPLKELSRGLTGGKKAAASAGVLGAESAVFTLSSKAGDLLSGVDVEPIDLMYGYGESLATLGAMRLAHWRPKGASVKLGADGRLKSKLRLSSSEAREISNAGVDPRIFISSLEESFKTSTPKTSKELDGLKSAYLKLMNSRGLSAATRSKLLYLVENKVSTTTPVVVDCSVQKLAGDKYQANLLDEKGNLVATRDFNTAKDLDTFLIVNRSEFRKNKIASCEEALLGKYDSDNFIRQAGLYADETGADVNHIAEAIIKKISGEELNRKENKIIADISRRSAYGDKGVGVKLYNLRKQLENEYNLNEGSLLAAVNRKAYRCSEAENRALDKYLSIMQKEVQNIENGVSREQYSALETEVKNSPYAGLGNEAIKSRERERYVNFVNADEAGWMNRNSYPDVLEGLGDGPSSRIKVPANWDKPYAWSFSGLRNSNEDMQRYRQRAEEMAESLGSKLNFLVDERELSNVVDDAEYNSKIRAVGWLDNSTGKVYINLPNVKNMEELERTVVHEIVGHRGLSNLFGEYIFDFYDELYNMADTEVREGIKEIGAKYPVKKGYIPVEEYLAHLAEKNYHTRKERTFLDKVKNFVNDRLESLNLVSSNKSKVTTKELCRMLADHHDAMLKRVKPDDYRAKVFKKFPSANLDVNYYDTEAFNKGIKQRIANNTLFENTPDFLMDDKKLLYDEHIERYKNKKAENAYRFIGERGADNLSEAENGRLNEVYLLKEAKEMEKRGATPQEIWEETSWARGADGLWRSEIEYDTMQTNDFIYNQLSVQEPQKASIYKKIVEKPSELRSADENKFIANLFKDNASLFKNLRVRDVVSDPLLYAAYPELAHLPVKVAKHIPEHSYYDAKNQTLYINQATLEQPDLLAKTIVKPVQQMIQHYEGFEKSVSLLRSDIQDTFSDEYMEAVLAVRALDNIYSKGKNMGIAPQMESVFKEKYGVFSQEFKKMYPSINEYIFSKMSGKPLSFMGNVEARNVMERQSLSYPERMLRHPSSTEDYPRDKQISVENFGKIRKMLSGPMDMIYENIMNNQHTRPIRLSKTSKKADELNLTPIERRVLEAQYDNMSSKFIDAYIALRKNTNMSETEALNAASDILDELAMQYIKSVEREGLHKPAENMGYYGDAFYTHSYKPKRNYDDLKDVERKLKQAALPAESKARRREYYRDLLQRTFDEKKNKWVELIEDYFEAIDKRGKINIDEDETLDTSWKEKYGYDVAPLETIADELLEKLKEKRYKNRAEDEENYMN